MARSEQFTILLFAVGAIVFVFLRGSVSSASDLGEARGYGNLDANMLTQEETALGGDSAGQLLQQAAPTDNPKPVPYLTTQENFVVQNDTGVEGNIEASSERGTEIAEYAVQEGDVLSGIAFDYGVTMKTIIWANKLSNPDKLKPGTILKIPPIDGVVHVVKSGDTVEKIGKTYTVETDKIIEFNGLPKEGNLRIGDEIIVPGGVIKVETGKKNETKQQSGPKRFAYLPTYDGYYILPVGPQTRFGRNRAIHGRNGVDVDVTCGTPIYSAAPGTIASTKTSGYNHGAGKMVLINHDNGTQTFYAHLSQVSAQQGALVGRGELIGYSGTTGNSTGCHLHIEFHGARNVYAR